MSLYLSNSLSTFLSMYQSMHFYLSVSLLVWRFICLSVHLYLYNYPHIAHSPTHSINQCPISLYSSPLILSPSLFLSTRHAFPHSRHGYFRYNETSGKMDEGYPKQMDKWNGLPDGLDAVFTWHDRKCSVERR